jgi:hypothetical protein
VAGWVAGFLQDRTFSEIFQAAFIGIAIAAVILALLVKPINALARRD